MKKIIIAMAAIAAVFTMASCNKEQLTEPGENVEGNCIVSASTESALTKTALQGNDTDGYEVVWSEGDTFKLRGETFTLIKGAGTASGTFQGIVTPYTGPYDAYYPASYDGSNWPLKQTYTEGNGITGSPMKADVFCVVGQIEGGKVEFKNVGGILRLTVKGSSSVSVTSISVCTDNILNITLDCGTGAPLNETNGTVFHIAMPEGSYSGTSIQFTTSDGRYCTKTLKADKPLVITRSQITPASITVDKFKHYTIEDALPEPFTLSDDGNGNVRKVFFSKGNLWCDTETNPSAGNFHFENNQYDTAPTISADRVIDHISHFMWCRSAVDAVKPGYSETGKSTDDILFTNAAGFTVNGTSGWFAPSQDEMNYLLEKRKASTVGGTANARFFCGKIDKGGGNYLRGMFLIPDVFTWPESDLPAAPKGINQSLYTFNDNIYSVSEFEILQQEGVVFLPCAGYRDGFYSYTKVDYLNTSGFYWSSTLKDADNARHFGVSISGSGAYINERSKAYSIRLVTDLSDNPPSAFTVSFDMNGKNGTAPASITGVRYHTTISKPADPVAEGYTFWGWYKDAACTVEWDFTSDLVMSNVTLFAKWYKNPTVTFDSNGHGTTPSAITVPYHATITKPADPAAEGYTFWGWYKDKDCTAEWDFANDVATSDITLYANWKIINALSGTFTVNKSGKKVYFSKGNLWCDQNGTFNFEANQYDYSLIFDKYSKYNLRDDNHVSHFMWSKSADMASALQYNDPSASESDIFFTNADATTPNSNFTVNGQKGLWRMLSIYEWQYLINNNGSVWTTINGINGLIIFCDGYSGSRSGLTEIPQGCAFLPAAGFRDGDSGLTRVGGAGGYGYYWSSSPSDGRNARDLYFYGGDVNPSDYDARNRAQSVRLVTESK